MSIEQIRDILLEHKGIDNAIKSPKIAKLIGIKPGASNRGIRKLITNTIKKFMIPVAAHTHKGYFFIENREEFKNYLRTLDSWIKEIENRKTIIQISYYKHYKDEELELVGEIFDEEDDEEMGDFLAI
jgi:hypothetical protein